MNESQMAYGYDAVGRVLSEDGLWPNDTVSYSYAIPLWTIPRVGALIKQLTGWQYHTGHVWRLLRSFGWSSQRPTGRVLERVGS